MAEKEREAIGAPRPAGRSRAAAMAAAAFRPGRVVLMFALGGTAVGIGYGMLVTEGLLIGAMRGALVGALVGGLAAAFEVFVARGRLADLFARLPFGATLAIRTVAYFAIVLFSLVVGVMGMPGPRPTVEVFRATLERDIFFSLVAAVGFNFVNAMRQLIGGDVLLSFFTGRYHRPVREERVFLFVDLVGSTGLAHQLGGRLYHRLLNRFFQNVARAVLAHRGQIHRYIGDEMLISWPAERGLARARCVRAVFAARRAMQEDAAFFESLAGAVPTFRAGLHVGEVITGEIGFERVEIGFVGDAVNLAARLEQQARTAGCSVLTTRTLVERTTLPPAIAARSLGPVTLRGLSAPIELVALAPADEAPEGDAADAGAAATA